MDEMKIQMRLAKAVLALMNITPSAEGNTVTLGEWGTITQEPHGYAAQFDNDVWRGESFDTALKYMTLRILARVMDEGAALE